MNTSNPDPENSPVHLPAAKVISDLDGLVQAVLKAMPDAKPWQRQLRSQLVEVDRAIQVLRMTISMGRGSDEVAEAAASGSQWLRAANSYVSMGRADMGTKAAVRLAFQLAQNIDRLLAA